MTLVRRIARPLLAAPLITAGVDQLRHPGPRAEAAAPTVQRLAGPLHLPDDAELLVRVNGAAMVGAGALLATGRLPRLAALVLTATLVPAAYAGHRFWEEKDPETRRTQRRYFLENLGLLGGALLATVDTEGRPGVAWRTQRAAKDAKKSARHAKKEARLVAKQARREALHAAHRAGDAVGV